MEVTRVPFPPVDRHQCSPVVELLLDKNDEGLFDDSIRYEEFPKRYSGPTLNPMKIRYSIFMTMAQSQGLTRNFQSAGSAVQPAAPQEKAPVTHRIVVRG